MWKILIMRFVMVLKVQKLTVHVARIEDRSNALDVSCATQKSDFAHRRERRKHKNFLWKPHHEDVSWNVVAEKITHGTVQRLVSITLPRLVTLL